MGTIRRHEAVRVIRDVLERGKVPKSVWSLTPTGELNFMIGSRIFRVTAKANFGFYQLKDLEAAVEAAVRDYWAQPDRRQVDIEDLTRATA